MVQLQYFYQQRIGVTLDTNWLHKYEAQKLFYLLT